MNINIEPVDEEGKKKFKLKVDGEKDQIIGDKAVGKTGIRIRINELITQIG